tara:strand:- start:571 stop:708 length:138 start_codon:yes stop_codon:yes gene_type:complete
MDEEPDDMIDCMSEGCYNLILAVAGEEDDYLCDKCLMKKYLGEFE